MNNGGLVARITSSLCEPTFSLHGTEMSVQQGDKLSCPNQVLMRLSEGLRKQVKLLDFLASAAFQR